MSQKDLLEPILQSPMLPKLVEELSRKIEEEAEARTKFLEEITPEMKAEFISGQVCMQSPARKKHLDITRRLFIRLGLYCEENKNGGTVFSEKCLISLTRNDFEPDIVWFSPEKADQFDDDQMQFPAPDFVVEVLSQSTATRDRGVKFEDYALHGVSEYWIIDPDDNCVEIYTLENDSQTFQLHRKITSGIVASHIIEGFEISWDAIFT